MVYKINLNNTSQNYLEYKDKMDLYESLKNTTFLTLRETYEIFLDFSLNTAYLRSDFYNISRSLIPLRNFAYLLFEKEDFFEFYNFVKNISLVGMAIFSYPYIYNCLDNITLNNLLNEKNFDKNTTEEECKKRNIEKIKEIAECCNFLAAKIEEKKCIFFEKKLKELQIKIIQLYKLNNEQIFQYSYFYQTIFYLKDIDFCLKLFFKILDQLYPSDIFGKIVTSFSIINIDKRISSFEYYYQLQQVIKLRSIDTNILNNLSDLENEEIEIINNSLKIKHTLVIGEKNFQEFIKSLNLSTKQFFLQFEELKDFCSTLKDFKINDRYLINKYFMIIEDKNFYEYYKSLNLLSFTYGVLFIIIIYIHDENQIYINKNIINGEALMPMILCFSKEDIIYYFNDNEKMECGYFLTYKLHLEIDGKFKSLFTQDLEQIKSKDLPLEYDDGWEMIIDNENFFKNLYILSAPHSWNMGKAIMSIYELYKEKDNLELYLKYYCNYFGANLYTDVPEVLFMKFFIYAFTIDEGHKDKSFFALLNDTLRSGNYEKINKFIDIFAKLLELIKDKAIMSYKGKVYRASKFKDNLLMQIKKGKKMVNTSLWSSTKDENVAKSFKTNYNKNVIIYTNLNGNFNIDIHEEKLSRYAKEKEVLILPFCIFEVKDFIKVNDHNNGDYYKLDLELLNEYNNLEIVKHKTLKMEDFLDNY